MTRGIRRFVEVDDAGADEGFEIAFERGAANRYRSEMTGADEKLAVIPE